MYFVQYFLIFQFICFFYFLYIFIFVKRQKKQLFLALFSLIICFKLFVPIYPFFYAGDIDQEKNSENNLESYSLKLAFFPITEPVDLTHFVNLGIEPDLLILHAKRKNSVFDGFYSNYKYQEVYENSSHGWCYIYSKLPIENFSIKDLEVGGHKLLNFEINALNKKQIVKIFTIIQEKYDQRSNHNLDLLNRRLATILRAEKGSVILANSMFATPFTKAYSRLLKGANFKHVAWEQWEFLMNLNFLQNQLLYKGKIKKLSAEKLLAQSYLVDFIVN